MRVILAGGGTLGSVSPLLALKQELSRRVPDCQFLWVGTKTGPEIPFVSRYGIAYKAISSGKLRRYADPRNLFDPFRILAGYSQSRRIIKEFKPDVVLTAGSFVAVPVARAAARKKIFVLVQQQDVRVGLANKLMAKHAKLITVTFADSLKDFPAGKTVHTGNPVRAEVLGGNRDRASSRFGLDPLFPTLLVLGGSTGAQGLNDLVTASLDQLLAFCQVLHITVGKSQGAERERYHPLEFVGDELADVYAAADLVVSRAGMSTLSELAALGKPTIIIPLPASHQEDNALAFLKANAALVVDQTSADPESFSAGVRDLLSDRLRLQELGRQMKKLLPQKAAEKIVDLLI